MKSYKLDQLCQKVYLISVEHVITGTCRKSSFDLWLNCKIKLILHAKRWLKTQEMMMYDICTDKGFFFFLLFFSFFFYFVFVFVFPASLVLVCFPYPFSLSYSPQLNQACFQPQNISYPINYHQREKGPFFWDVAVLRLGRFLFLMVRWVKIIFWFLELY